MKTIFKSMIVVGIFSLIIVTVTYFNMGTNSSNEFQKPRAAILDMMYTKQPNKYFDDTAETYLRDAGYQVDTYKTENITVDFYKKLPTMNYKFIVFRTHGLPSGTFEKSASIFTGEIYSKNKYFSEQMTRQLEKGVPYLRSVIHANGGYGAYVNETYFVIGSKFIDQSMIGKFPDSVILIGGCDVMSNNELAKSFVSRGASVVVGWNDLVSLDDNDRGILMVMHETVVSKKSMDSAIKSVMANFTADSIFPAKLKYYTKGLEKL